MAFVPKIAGRPCKVALPHEFPRSIEQLSQNLKFLKDEVEQLKCSPSGGAAIDCETLLDLLRTCEGFCALVCGCNCDSDTPITPNPPIPNPTDGRPYAILTDPFGQVWISEAGKVGGPFPAGPNGWVVDPVANAIIKTLDQPDISLCYGLVYVPPTREVWVAGQRSSQRIAVDIYDAASRTFKVRKLLRDFGEFCFDLAWSPRAPGVVYCQTNGPSNEILWLDVNASKITGSIIIGQTVVDDPTGHLAESMVAAPRSNRIFMRCSGNFLTSFRPGDALATGPLPTTGIYLGASGQSRNAIEMADGSVYWHPERIDFIQDMPLEGAFPAAFQDVGGGQLQMFNTEHARVQGFTVFSNPEGDVLGTVSTTAEKVALHQLGSLNEEFSADLGFAGGRGAWVPAIDGFGVVLRAHTEDDPADMTTLVRFWGRDAPGQPPIDTLPNEDPGPGNGGTTPDLDTVYTNGCTLSGVPFFGTNIGGVLTITAFIAKLVTVSGHVQIQAFPGVTVRLDAPAQTGWTITGQGGVTDPAGEHDFTVTRSTPGGSVLDLYATAPGYPEVKTGAHPFLEFV